MPLFGKIQNTLLEPRQWLTGSAKGVIYVLVKTGFFVFCLIYLAHMGRWNEASDVYQKSNWGGTGSFRLEKIFYLWSWSRLGIPHSAAVFPMRFLGWAVSFFTRNFQRALLRCLSLSFLPQSGAVECRRMSCPPLNCSPDSLPVHIAGQCCKVCRRKYWLRVRVALCALRFIPPSPYFRP